MASYDPFFNVEFCDICVNVFILLYYAVVLFKFLPVFIKVFIADFMSYWAMRNVISFSVVCLTRVSVNDEWKGNLIFLSYNINQIVLEKLGVICQRNRMCKSCTL